MMHRRNVPWLMSALALLLVLILGAGSASAQDPTLLFEETFENVPDGVTPQMLDEYEGFGGEEYTAHPNWVDPAQCNGIIISGNSPNHPGGCAFQNQLRNLVTNLGTLNGTSPPEENFAVSAYTAGDPGAGNVQFATVNPLPIQVENRFLIFSVNVSAVNCGPGPPQLRFFLDDGSNEIPATTDAISPCDTTDTFTTDGSILFTGTELGIVMRNDYGSGVGNDHAFDDIRLLDATPQLDKAFAPDVVDVGATTTLTFTITNTSELASKLGWSFTDVLPTGLTIASPANADTTCTNGTITAAAGGDTIEVSGDLEAGQASCTASVDVTSSTAGAYENGPDNIESVGLNPPEPAEVTFIGDPGISIEKTASGPEPLEVGGTIEYSFLVTNTGDVTLTQIEITDPLVSPVTCPQTELDPDEVMTCTGSYTVTQDDVDAGSVENTASVTGTPPGDLEPPTDESTTTFPPDQNSGISIEKSGSGPDPLTVGATIDYEFLVTNTGNVTLTNVEVTDPLPGLSPIDCPDTTLAPGAEMTCTATYEVTQGDVDAGVVENTATVSGETPTGGPPPTDESTTTVPPAEPVPAMPPLAFVLLLALLATATLWTLRRART